MKKSNGKLVVFFITLFLLAVVYDGNVIYGSENETVTRKYTFISNYKRDTGKGFDNNITENGEEYRLEEVTQKVINAKALKKKKKKTITKTSNGISENKEYIPEEKIVKDNITYQLKKTEKEENTVNKGNIREVTGYLDFDNKSAAANAPENRTFTANGATAECKKQRMEKLKANSWQDSYINLTFISYDADYYEWNGVQIDGSSKNPLKGYEKEILKSIGADTKNYRVVTTYWTGKAYQKDGVYYRKAKADIQKKIPHYRVHYKGYSKPKSKKICVYTSTYEATVYEKTGEYEYTIEATAVFRKIETAKETSKIIRIGIILLSFIVAGILFIVYFTSGKDEKKHIKEHGNLKHNDK